MVMYTDFRIVAALQDNYNDYQDRHRKFRQLFPLAERTLFYQELLASISRRKEEWAEDTWNKWKDLIEKIDTISAQELDFEMTGKLALHASQRARLLEVNSYIYFNLEEYTGVTEKNLERIRKLYAIDYKIWDEWEAVRWNEKEVRRLKWQARKNKVKKMLKGFLSCLKK